jgi:hypothetical protein
VLSISLLLILAFLTATAVGVTAAVIVFVRVVARRR